MAAEPLPNEKPMLAVKFPNPAPGRIQIEACGGPMQFDEDIFMNNRHTRRFIGAPNASDGCDIVAYEAPSLAHLPLVMR